MNVLPQFLYLLQTLPISIPNRFFKKLESMITRFIGKVARIELKTLYNTPQYGGLKLPNFEHFNWAAQLRAIWFWQTEMNNPPAWRKIEQVHAADVPLASIPFIQSYYSLKNKMDNPFINHTTKLWSDIQTCLKCVKPLHRNTPFHSNPALPSALRDGLTKIWHNEGVKTFGDLYENNVLRSFEQLRHALSLPASHFFKYLQVRHYISTQQGSHLNPSDSPWTEEIFKSIQHPKGILNPQQNTRSLNKQNPQLQWEQDLNFTFEDCDWQKNFVWELKFLLSLSN